MLQTHTPRDSTEAAHLKTALDFVASNPLCSSRSNLAGHVTASAWILSPDGKSALLTHHKKLNRWLQLGGHTDDADTSIQAAAAREAREESGMTDLRLLSDALFDVDVHPIPARGSEPAHYHYDLRFSFQAQHVDFNVSEESHALAWVPLATLAAEDGNASVARMARKSLGVSGFADVATVK
ncbi:NUDIX hydrolase [Undibacterium sp. YM2]|uniref:NUDIX hydrolase n=1 Tax=Undibacterium sp. YM2 TaxID=2058625 RepID=UPI001331E027|nr:NUDIX domain-containing protein [Undibacterium sp. YM2]BBB68472.1 NUDIX hydrolase [Undibacterium sp. YM2]